MRGVGVAGGRLRMTPETPEALREHVRDEAEVHLHFHDMGLSRRWVLQVLLTKLCGTERCARIRLVSR